MLENKAVAVFEELLRAGLWGTPLSERWKELQEEDWKQVLWLARQQTVQGLVFDGLQVIKDAPALEKLMFGLTVQVIRIEQLNKLLDRTASHFSEQLRENGVQAVLLKGQGVATLYPHPKRRQCGDIDLFVGVEQFERAKQLFQKWGYPVELEQMGDKHLKVIEKNGINLDIHWITTMPLSPKLDKPLRLWEQTVFREQREYVSLDGIKVQVPPPQFNAIFLFMHMFNHFMSEGVSYRQVCDWGLSLRDERVRQNHSLLEKYIRQYDLVQPWKVFSYVAVHRLGFNAVDFPLYQGDCKQKAEVVLRRIYEGGNFGKYRKWKDYRHLPWLLWKLGSFWNHQRNIWTVMHIFPKQCMRYYRRVWQLVFNNIYRKLACRK